MGYLGEHSIIFCYLIIELNSKGHLWRLSVCPVYIVTGLAET